ncbi:MAG: T9SS type A sorting domain-containing protein, partial [Fidelibacterota bacterium]
EPLCMTGAVVSGVTGGNELFVDIGPCLEPLLLGDANLDGIINVSDVVEIVGIIFGEILPSDEQLYTSDYNQDGAINVQDIVELVCVILECNVSKGIPLAQAIMSTDNNRTVLKVNGTAAGLQLAVSGDFEITQSYLPAGWEIHSSEDTILLFSLDGSPLTSETLFEYSGDLVIESALVSDWLGNGIYADIETLPESFSLGHAYPNPFNPVTTFEYHLPVDANVSIQVFDLTGREVAELIPENTYMIAGSYTAMFTANDLPSGLYFVAMRAKSGIEEFTAKQKIILLK